MSYPTCWCHLDPSFVTCELPNFQTVDSTICYVIADLVNCCKRFFMNSFTGFIKVRVGLCFITGSAIEMNTDTFRDRLYTTEEQIRSSIILPLNESIGLHNWAIQFIELTPHSKSYLVDIWADRYEDYPRIFYIIRDHLPDCNLTPFYQGTVSQRLKRELIPQV